jgi:uncharacterized membrane protein YraQ (UPF0718 family)
VDSDRFDEKANRKNLIRSGFGPSFWTFVVIAAGLALICYMRLGPDDFATAVSDDARLLADLLPRVLVAQLVAGFVWVLLPRDKMSQLLQRNQGRRGLLLAAAAGTITPGGPSSAFPFLAILAGTGADRGILVAYITGWALLGVQRIIVWDIPLLGADFSLLRFAVCAPLPILAGALARRLPMSATLRVGAPPGHSEK